MFEKKIKKKKEKIIGEIKYKISKGRRK